MGKDSDFISKVWNKTGGLCWYCGCDLVLSEKRRDGAYYGPDGFCIEHLVPQIKGGTDALDNLVPACRHCNSRKRTRSVEEYREWLRWVNVGVTRFTTSQIDWLRQHGIEVPEPPRIIFYFEKMERTVG